MAKCIAEEQRSVIRFLWSECVKPSEIYRRMKVQSGDSCLSQGRVYEWVERFQNVSDEHRRGRPVSVATETVKQQIPQRMRDYRLVTIDEIAVEFNMSHGSAYNIVHNDLGCRKVCSRWVPRQLSDDHKRARQTICQEHLDRHAREGDAFLHLTDRRRVLDVTLWTREQETIDAVEVPVVSGQQKIQDTGFRWESHADHLLGCHWPYIGALPGRGSNFG
jgi:transposase